MRSIRVDLTTRLLLGLGLVVIGVSVVSYVLVKQAVEADFDGTLASKARALAALVSFDEEGFELHLAEQAAPEYQARPEAEYLQMWIEDGPVVARSPSLGNSDLPRRAGELDTPALWDQDLPDGRPGRAVGLLVQANWDEDSLPDGTAGPPRVLIVTARSRSTLDGTLAGVATIFSLGCIFSLLLIGGIVHSSVRRALEPVKRLSGRMDAIDAATLSHRVSDEGLPQELAFIPPKLNALLQRLEQAFDRERRMTSNMAHELRTPLAALRTATEVARRWSDDEELAGKALSTAHDVALQMGDLVEALLRLSRIACGEARLGSDDLRLAPAVGELWKRVSSAADERRQDFDLAVPADLVIRTDEGLLGVAVGNLLGNAVQHGAAGEPIRCQARADKGSVRLTVSNGANGLRPEDLGRLCEPFWRGDEARSGRQHAGLGLALVDAVADALAARLSFDVSEGRFQAHLDLPQ